LSENATADEIRREYTMVRGERLDIALPILDG
jgi:hypothetical protein